MIGQLNTDALFREMRRFFCVRWVISVQSDAKFPAK
jgi:hypothetical protein